MENKISRSATMGMGKTFQIAGTWKEIFTNGTVPRRRSYHSAVSWRYTLLILGGQDLREGALEGLWMLRLDPNHPDAERWVKLKIQGGPPAISRHSAVIHRELMYIYGGTNTVVQFNSMYILNLEKMIWRRLDSENQSFPPKMDSHSCVYYKERLVFFAGYINGYRSNLIHIFEIPSESWEVLQLNGPQSRSNHSASIYKNFLYIFGGLDEDHSALNDFWKLNLETWHWSQINLKGDSPAARSGHTCTIYRNYLILFGGIKEIGHETNELFYCNLESHEWALIFHSEVNQELIPNNNYLNVQSTNFQVRKSVDHIKQSPQREENKEKTQILRENEKAVVVPCARDGHSACLIENKLYVFGGDKHQMSFNDLYVYSIEI